MNNTLVRTGAVDCLVRVPHAAAEFAVPFRGHQLLGDRWTPPEIAGTALILHGGGSSSVARFEALRAFLFQRNIETLGFDCIGHGRTGGAQLGSTLEERVLQVLAVVESEHLNPAALALLGFSMGAYVAVKAGSLLGASGLCLAIPAAYTALAFTTPFGPLFSQLLRAPRSWVDSDAFDLVRAYAGHLLVVSAENDVVVPAEISRRYLSSGTHCASRAQHVIARSGHDLIAHFEREPQAQAAAYTAIASLCLRGVP